MRTAFVAVAAITSMMILSAPSLCATADAKRLRTQRPSPAVVAISPSLYAIEKRALVSLAMDAVAGELAAQKHAKGFELTDMRDTGAASLLGLAAGDVIKSIAGVPLGDAAAIVAADKAARDADWITVELLRGGQPLTVHYHLLDGSGMMRLKLASQQGRARTSLIEVVAEGINRKDQPFLVDRSILEAVGQLLPRSAVRSHMLVQDWAMQVLSSTSVLNSLGLQTFDLITHVGTKKVQNRLALVRELTQAAATGELEIEVQRRGKKLSLRYQVVSGLLKPETLKQAVTALSTAARLSAHTPPPASGADIDYDAGITLVREGNYKVKQSLIDAVAAAPLVIARSARIVPSVKNGKANGFKLYAIRRGSLYKKLGLRNGDTIHSMNKYSFTSPDKALEAFVALKTARKITLSLTRRSKPMKLFYTITR